LTVEDYLEDFATEESKAELGKLLALCRRAVPMRTRRIQDERSKPEDQAELRRDAYKQAGEYVVDHCDVLIAVWDGQPARGRGGTAEVVKYAREQNRPIIRVWGDMVEVVKNAGLDASALDAIDKFNRQPITPEQRAAYAKNLDREHFEKPETAGGIPASVREFVNRCLFPYYAQASIVAKGNQKRFHQAGKIVYALSAAAVGCAAVAVLFRELAWAGFSAELALLLVIWQTWRQVRREQPHLSWIENRFLAERLRCGIFMAICGVEPRPLEVLPFMGHAQTVNDWTMRVFDEIWDRLPPLAGCSSGECLSMNRYVRDVWIGEQVKFHNGKKEREGRLRERLAKAGEIVLPVTIGAAALHLLLLALVLPEAAGPVHWAHDGLAFIALLFPAIAASLAGMEAHREHLRLEKSSANMAVQLARLGKKMESATDPARFESLLQQAGDVMLQETQGWLMLMRYVEIKAS
jgi:hypothetical protein